MEQVTIDGDWSYDDLGFYLAPDPIIGEAKPKEYYIDIPYGDGVIDLTESLTGNVSYENRMIEFGFIPPENEESWHTMHKELQNRFNGRYVDLVMPQHPDYIFIGRMTVGRLEINDSVPNIPIKVNCHPYMFKKNKTIINRTISESTILSLNLDNERMLVVPEFTISKEAQITFNNKIYTHSAGTFKNAGIYLEQGLNQIKIVAASGTTVRIEYQEGSL